MDYIRAIRPVVRHHSACLNRRDSEAFINEVTLHAVLRLHPRDMRNLTTVETRHCAASMRALWPFGNAADMGRDHAAAADHCRAEGAHPC